MKNFSVMHHALALLAIGSTGLLHAAEPYRDTIDRLKCGPRMVTIQSRCAKSDGDMALNTCKAQAMSIGTRSVILPELDQRDVAAIRKEGGTPAALFVVKMGCAQVRKAHYPILYYSIGGGSAPHAEVWTAYDASGRLLPNEKFPLDGKMLGALDKKMHRVQSIMPR
ncbi:MAG: hypothetical protein M3Y65_13690 [Pseudomonadota bacterium]|nr:hypothetical protein [Pseudomonadota bacterium]